MPSSRAGFTPWRDKKSSADIDLSVEPAGKYLLIIGSENDRKEFIIIKE